MIGKISAVFLAAAFALACSKNPITGRSQAQLVSEAELQSMAQTQYQQFLASHSVVNASTNRDAEMVKRVGRRITNAVTEFFASKGDGDELRGYNWEYNL